MYLALTLSVILVPLAAPSPADAQNPCTPPVQNPTVCENSKAGNPKSEWDITAAGDLSIQGFATEISVNAGQTIFFKIATNASDYRLDIYRLGYYGGLGARRVATNILPSASLPQSQPACLNDTSTGLIDCGNWAVSASWPVPSTAVSGIYIAKVTRNDTGGASHIAFVVRNDSRNADLLFQTSDTTWQAYNKYGGNSVYSGAPAGRAYKVSYNRPFFTRIDFESLNWIFAQEYPMIRWLEANGYNVNYITGIDTDRRGDDLLRHKAFLSVGHDEYWSGAQRGNVEAARAAGIHLAFLSGNEVFWKIRWEPSIDGSNTPYRTLVVYKETHANAKIDPLPNVWTGTWRDPRFSPPADGGRPENALTGTIFTVNCCRLDTITVPAEFGRLRFWRNTRIAALPPGDVDTIAPGTLGDEWDEDLDNGFRPPGLIRLSLTTVNVSSYLLDHGSTYGNGTATHALTLYRHSSGALVFGAGTIRWSWGLDGEHDPDPTALNFVVDPDLAMQQATVNLFADMGGVQPGTLQPTLVPATTSTDTVRPTSTISQPGPGFSVEAGNAVVIAGTAADTGGVVAAVEVSTDGGATWHPATGRDTWSYLWQPGVVGPATIMSRSVDDSGNIQSPATQVAVTVTQRTCPCSIWSDAVTPQVASDPDTGAIEVGVKFRADIDGYISGLRFYKGAQNTGTHVGNLWTSSGTLLASVTFRSETASGWQQEPLPAPVPINANTTYVVSYHTSVGRYAFDSGGLTNGVSNTPLQAPASLPAGGNGVFAYGPTSSFPTQSFFSGNYWVDVVFNTTSTDTIAPEVIGVVPAAGASGASPATSVQATFTEEINSASISFVLRNAAGNTIPATVNYTTGTRTATLTPQSLLAESAVYTATIAAADLAGNPLSPPVSWSFTTAGTAPSIWGTPPPAVADSGDTQAAELGLKFRSEIDGFIRGIRFYKSAANTGVHTANLWTSAGELLASTVFTNETASGWQQVIFAAPVPITANTVYVASYHTPSGRYSVTSNFFASAGVTNFPLRALSDTEAGGNGVYRYGSTGFPAQTFNATNYWVDVVFSKTNVDTVSPTVLSHSPAAGANNASPTAPITARFSENMVGSSISFVLRNQSNNVVPASVNYDSPSRTATLTPTSALAIPATYTATVGAGTDMAGNPLPAPVTWSFATPTCPCTIWNATTVPSVVDSGDPSAVELGVKFRAESNGYITGLRFYKSAANTGIHTANLWTSTGSLLATAIVAGETSSGWQQVNFPGPISVTANTVYVASYHTPAGRYSANSAYFSTADVSGFPVRALSEAEAGGNGVYRYGAGGFPTQAFNANNYWVDVVFNVTVPPDTTSPTVVAVNPAAGATGVPANSAITVTFSESMDAATISTNTIELRNAGNSLVPATVTYNAAQKVATVTPATSLALSNSHTVRVLGGATDPRVKDPAGNALAATFASSFTTVADTTPPTVVSVSPVNGAIGVSGTTTVTVTFNEGMDPATISTSTIELRTSPAGTLVPAAVTYNSATRTATLSPASPLSASTTHNLTVRGGAADPRVKDAFSNALAATFTSSFTTAAASPSIAGQWSPPAVWPQVAVHAMLLKTGEVLLWDGPSEDQASGTAEGGGDTATLWSPTTNTFTAVPNLVTDLFCSGHAVLADGRILAVGGHLNGGVGLRNANIFDPVTRQWTAVAPMNYARWYPTATTLSDGRVLVVSGSTTCQACIADVPEIYDPVSNSWTALPNARNPVDLYPYNFLLSDGRVVAVGSYDAPAFVTKVLDLATQTWTDVDPRPLNGGSAAMYLPGKIVKSGSARQVAGQLSTADTWVIDMNAALPTWRQTAPMNFPRMYHTMTSLPDGTVLVTGGGRVGDTTNLAAAVLEPEIWSPVTETWTALAPMQTPRLYHSIALLLPDGRVLVAGSGRTEGIDELSAELYSPPYLFKGARPVITSTPPSIQYGSSFFVATPDGAAIASVALIRAGSVTHTFHGDQRFLPVTFQQVSGGLQINAPADANLAPPGNYMLFLVNANGVPAIAPFVALSALSVVRDTTFSDFAAGTPDANVHLADGQHEVILRPSMVSDFSGTQLPAGWSATPWQAGGGATVGGGLLRVDGARTGTDALRGFGVLEFGAIFGVDSYQHVGVGLTLNETPFAIFSTGGGGQILARSHDGTTATDTVLGGDPTFVTAPHVFRIDWTSTGVVFSIDEQVVASHPVAIAGALRPLTSDYSFGGGRVTVDWLRMSPYPASGTFLSRVFDGGGQVKWGPLWWDGYTPPGTTLVLSARTGNTSVPDGSWSAFVPVANSGASIGSTARYVQYRAVLSTTDATRSPAVWSVTIGSGTP